MLSRRTDLRGLVFRSEHPKENAMIDTGHVGATSDNIGEATQRIATIVAYAQAARHFLDHRPPDLDEVRQALDCIVTNACLAGDVIYRIRGLRALEEAPPSANSVVDRGVAAMNEPET